MWTSLYHSSGPSLFMVLSRPDAVSGWRALMGPTDPSKAKENQPDRFGLLLTRPLYMCVLAVWEHCLVLIWPRMLYMAVLIVSRQKMPLRWYLVMWNWMLCCQNHHQQVDYNSYHCNNWLYEIIADDSKPANDGDNPGTTTGKCVWDTHAHDTQHTHVMKYS